MKNGNLSQVVKVYGNIQQHRAVADLIRRRFLTNKQDVRDVALAQIDFQTIRNILDLGCGFGFFTEALQGKIPGGISITGVDLIPGHEHHFLRACSQSGATGRFVPGNVSVIKAFADRSFDLILCSYALYFFPEMIPHIARILKREGVFVTITHDNQNMRELFDCIKHILELHYDQKERLLPAERIIRKFSSKNGAQLLAPWFRELKMIDYPNALVYHLDDINEIIEYFHFKSPFFLEGTQKEGKDIAIHLPPLLRRQSQAQDGVIISKNDRIFICAAPKQEEVSL